MGTQSAATQSFHRSFDQWVAANVRRLRAEVGWSQAELAGQLLALGYPGWTGVIVAAAELGRRRVSLADLVAFCDAFEVGLPALLAAPAHLDQGPALTAKDVQALLLRRRLRPDPRLLAEGAGPRRDARLHELESEMARRLGVEVAAVRDATAHTFPRYPDLLAVRDELTRHHHDQAVAAGNDPTPSRLAGHATRQITSVLAEWLGRRPSTEQVTRLLNQTPTGGPPGPGRRGHRAAGRGP